jgi:hypothetical protein
MTALRIERRTIMSLLFGGERTEHRVPASRQPMSAFVIQHAVE